MLTVRELVESDTADSTDADFAVFDLESAPLDDATLAAICPACEMPERPREFDPAGVKYGNTKDPLKRAEKLNEERAKHEAAVKSYDQRYLTAAAEHFAKFKGRAALDATTGRVVAIGCIPCLLKGNGPGIIDCDGEQEESGLRLFWEWVADNLDRQRPMLGFNTHSFDLPFIVRRSWILGVPIPIGVRQGRYWHPLFIDVMRAWGFDQPGQFVSMNTVALAFGIAGKVSEVDGDPIEGATFYLAWRDPERRKTAEAYLLQDIKLPWLIAQRMGII